MRILVVEDSATDAQILGFALEKQGHSVKIADSAEAALDAIRRESFPLVISDWELPGLTGIELCKAIRSRNSHAYTYIILLTSRQEKRHMIEGLAAGADDYLTKPFEPQELYFRIRGGERLLAQQGRDLIIFSLAKLAESRDPETGEHLERIREYSRLLTQALADHPDFHNQIDADFIESIYLTSPLHDIGKVGIPDRVLLKPDSLTPEEFELMKQHAVIGGETLNAAAEKHPHHEYLWIARDIALTHHERFDGKGYPLGLAGEEIPLCGRIVAVADVYDALTSKRVYKSAFSHQKSAGIIRADSGTHFDPRIVNAFLQCEQEFDQIRCSLQDVSVQPMPPHELAATATPIIDGSTISQN